jgi:hypothetical protein
MKLKLIVGAALLIVFGFSSQAVADDRLPIKIYIESTWAGLGPSQRTVVVIERNGDQYRFTSTHTEQTFGRQKPEQKHTVQSGMLDVSKIKALVLALRANPVPAPDAADIGITRAWLRQHVDDDGYIHERVAAGAPNQQALFRSAFTNPDLIQKLFPDILSSFHTDDYPSVDVSAEFGHGAKLVACASGQHSLMLPWVLSGSCAHFDADAGPRTLSYNAAISRAVASLMPSDATGQSRLSGDGMASELSEAVMNTIETEWKQLDAENKAGDALARLRSRYSVAEAEIDNYHHPEYGTTWDNAKPYAVAEQVAEKNLHATLVHRTLPPNMTFALVLPYADGKVRGVNGFLDQSDAYSARVLAVPWLGALLRQHSKTPFRISYVHDASMGDKAMRTFSADMHRIDRDGLIAEVQAARERAILLIVGDTYSETYWILMPDNRLILWRFGGPSGLLKWSASDFKVQDCADYQEVEGGCVGAVISASGELQK